LDFVSASFACSFGSMSAKLATQNGNSSAAVCFVLDCTDVGLFECKRFTSSVTAPREAGNHDLNGRRLSEVIGGDGVPSRLSYKTKDETKAIGGGPSRLAFWAAHLMSTHSNGMPARQLEDQLGLTYRTAWLLTQKLRRSMVDPDREPLEGSLKSIRRKSPSASVTRSPIPAMQGKSSLPEPSR
jgi:hypothetical protein